MLGMRRKRILPGKSYPTQMNLYGNGSSLSSSAVAASVARPVAAVETAGDQTKTENTAIFKPRQTNILQRKKIPQIGQLKRKVAPFKPPSRLASSSRTSNLPAAKGPTVSHKQNPAMQTAKQQSTVTYWTCMYTKRSQKKHKIYEDGVVELVPNVNCTLYDMSQKVVAKTRTRFTRLLDDQEIDILNKEVQIVKRLPDVEFMSGSYFITGESSASSSASSKPASLLMAKARKKVFSVRAAGTASTMSRKTTKLPLPRHDPNKEGNIVLSPGIPGKQVAIVLDPHLGKYLRPHQVDGVRFMFKCVTGQANPSRPNHCGCILADEMGLGKTLQSISLIWTLVKQGPRGTSLVKKAVIVTPSSLVMNWAGEFRKWLGQERCEPTAVNTTGKTARRQIEDFLLTSSGSGRGKVLILSYEMCTKYSKLIQKANESVGLLICDEGHRLKNAKGNKTIQALRGFKTNRIVLLTGTPVQNKLLEFFAMADFCNCGVLGDIEKFKTVFQSAIDKGRDKNASTSTKKLGEVRSKKLAELTSFFVLRRTSEVNQKYLPARHEIAVFCKLTTIQMQMYRSVVMGPDVSRFRMGRKMREGSDANPLPVISSLTQICNHPELLRGSVKKYLEDARQIYENVANTAESRDESAVSASTSKNIIDPFMSGKLGVLVALLNQSRKLPEKDRFVVVSNYTKTLDIIELICNKEGWQFCRLDGSTNNSLRQPIVDKFNASESKDFVFLLSSKAGGCGLNLIGANRIVLFDPAWNPATDRQAMARVWRDGQLKQVYIYRMFSTGTVEERIFQRQILKEEVARAVVDRGDEKGKGSSLHDADNGHHFSPEELKKLFAAPKDTICDTYDLISQLRLEHTPTKKKTGRKKIMKEDDLLLGSDADLDDLEESASSESSGSSDEDDSDYDDSENEHDRLSEHDRALLFPMYEGPNSITDSLLRSIIENGEDNGLVTFVRCQSIFPGKLHNETSMEIDI